MRNNYKVEGDKVIIEARKKSFSNDGGVIYVTIDKEDFDKIAAFPGTWYSYIHQRTKGTYIRGYYFDPILKKRVQPLLHRLLIECPKGCIVSHKDGDTLNCCRHNLVITKIGVKYHNTEDLQQEEVKPIKGVSWHKKKEKWEAKATVDKKRYNVGYFAKDQVAQANAAVEEFKRLGPDEYYIKNTERGNHK